ncbi:hypothetical protein GCM10027048_11540 [Hymenobacter coalescens]
MAAGLCSSAAFAQTTVTTLQPPRHAPAASRTTTVQATYSQAISGASLRLYSKQRGLVAGTVTGSGNTVTFTPTQALRPGEVLMASVTPAAGSSAPRQVFYFSTAVAGGSGTFTPAAPEVLGEQLLPKGLADMDGDGDLDLLSVTPTALKLRLNDGAGAFRSGTSFTINNPGKNVNLADVDGDCDVDLLAAFGNTAFLWRRLPTGFGSREDIDLGSTINAVTAASSLADVDGDGDLDLLATRTYSSFNVLVAVRLNDGTGGFSGTGTVSVSTNGNSTNDLAVGDIDNDGDVDVLTCAGVQGPGTGEISLRLNDGTGAFSGTATVPLDINPEAMTLGDVDNDGDLDVLVGSLFSSSVSVLLNGGAGQFGSPVRLNIGSVGTGVNHLNLGDVDADGDLDLLAGTISNTTGAVVLFRNNGGGTFGAVAPVATTGLAAGYPGQQVVGDVDGDGDLDVVVGSGSGAQAGTSAYLNNARPTTSRAAAAAQPLALWPNPAHNQLQVQAPAGAGQIRIYDALGRAVRAVPSGASGRPTTISVAGLPAGMYLVRAGAATGRVAVE